MSSSTSTNNDNNEDHEEEEDNLITVTVVDVTTTPASESFRVAPTTTTVSDWMEFVVALLPSLQPSDDYPTIQLSKDGVVLYTTTTTTATTTTASTTTTLAELGIVDQDIIAGRRVKRTTGSAATAAALTGPSSSPTTTTTSTGLDFTNLLSSHSNPTIPVPPSAPAAAAAAATYVYHGPTMNLQEAQYCNPHPTNMVTLLYEKPHLLKELNYYAPALAEQLISLQQQQQQQQSNPADRDDIWLARASDIYRHYMIQQSITTAVQKTTRYHLERDMQQRHLADPHGDPQAAEYMQQQQRQRLIQEQYEHVMNEYPESIVGRVLMLYIPVKINGFFVAAFCDSGAQQTIMSLSLARQCQLESYIDTRMAGVAVGVGTGVILGRIHMVQLEIQSPVTDQTYYFPCSITVMDDPPPTKAKTTPVNGEQVVVDDDNNTEAVGGKEMPFLLGLDMLKRHLCCIDLSQACLRFTQIRLSTTDDELPQYLEVPFLHEKDLLPSQGGTMKPPE